MTNTNEHTPTQVSKQTANFLQEEYTIDTPENVTFAYNVVGIGSRFIGALIDTLILAGALLLVNLLFVILSGIAEGIDGRLFDPFDDVVGWTEGVLLAIYAIINFVLFWGYYIFFELMWNGQTPGKRVAKIQVLRLDGNPIGFTEVAIRNLVRIIDFLPFGYGLGLSFMFFNRHARRLGDFAAGTIVVRAKRDIELDSLTNPALRTAANQQAIDEALLSRYPNLRLLTHSDYELIQDALRRYNKGQVDWQLLHQLSVAIAKKLDATVPSRNWQSSHQFLKEIATAYQARR